MMEPLLFLLAFHLFPGIIAEEIIGGHEAQPHTRPYMVIVVLFQDGEWKRCGGFLVEEDIVLTAAHCWGSPMDVFLGVHDILLEENTWQNIDVKKAIPHPKYSNKTDNNDIMILQLDTKAQLTAAVGLIRLPGESDHVRPGQVCSVAGWGNISDSEITSKLHEVDLVIQEHFQCERHMLNYDRTTELCVGDPQKKMCSSENFISGRLTALDVRLYRVTCQPFQPSSMNVILGANDIKLQEKTQQKIPEKEVIHYPMALCYHR
ncbi:PREDICTED: granzyme H-like [Elephantulus edwardii]|uniref:granzyme H-like n=1 Tax=Elephantulus edwardii TaxID=28737 RepID=UPI0003F0C329|nr:PREDICTED: granzyme H-like [Elephantulus edwardii]